MLLTHGPPLPAFALMGYGVASRGGLFGRSIPGLKLDKQCAIGTRPAIYFE